MTDNRANSGCHLYKLFFYLNALHVHIFPSALCFQLYLFINLTVAQEQHLMELKYHKVPQMKECRRSLCAYLVPISLSVIAQFISGAPSVILEPLRQSASTCTGWLANGPLCSANAPYPAALACPARALKGLVKSNPRILFCTSVASPACLYKSVAASAASAPWRAELICYGRHPASLCLPSVLLAR